MRSLVTGGSGFVGSHLVEALLEQGDQVRALVRGPGRLGWLSGIPGVELCVGALEDRASLDNAVRGAERVFHCAGVVKAGRDEAYFKANVQGTENLLQAVEQSPDGLDRFTYVSSQAAAGPSTIDAAIDEETPARPITPYGRSKLEGEQRVLARAERLPVTVVRPPAVYGPRDKDIFLYFKLAAAGIVPIPGFGPRRVAVVYVKDLARGLVLAAATPRARSRIYFLTSGEHDWIELADALRSAVGRGRAIRIPAWVMRSAAWFSELYGGITGRPVALNRHKARELTQRAWRCSDRRARRDLGYAPASTLLEGMKETASWYREAGWIPG